MTDYAFAYNGLTFGGAGAAVQVLSVTGIEDAPSVRNSDEARGFADGMFYGRDFLGARIITCELLVLPTSGLSFRQVLEQLKAALVPQGGSSTDAGVLSFTLPGLATRRVYGRVRRRSLPISDDYSFGYAKAAVEFLCADPRIYDDTASSLVLTLGSPPTGLSFSLGFSASFGTAVTPNSGLANNAGTYATKPIIAIQGPVDTPIIQNATTGQQLRLNTVLGPGDVLTIDTDTRAILLNGTASRRSSLSYDSTWFDLAPGATTLLFSAAAQTTATATVTWRNAYL